MRLAGCSVAIALACGEQVAAVVVVVLLAGWVAGAVLRELGAAGARVRVGVRVVKI